MRYTLLGGACFLGAAILIATLTRANIPEADCYSVIALNCSAGGPGGSDHTCDTNDQGTGCVNPGATSTACTGTDYTPWVCAATRQKNIRCKSTGRLPCGTTDRVVCTWNAEFRQCEKQILETTNTPCEVVTCER